MPVLYSSTGRRSYSSLRHPSASPSTRSNEAELADDELSELSVTMGPVVDEDVPRYPGEDTRFTSRKELTGFYAYGWAAEVFVVCGIGSFIPITLEQLARERGVLQSDGKTPCSTPEPPFVNVTNTLSRNFTTNGDFTAQADPSQCIVYIAGVPINTASFAMYTFSISVLIQALLIISMSGAADHGRFRKTFLLYFAFIGSIATMLFLPLTPKVFLLGALFAMIANTCFGASFVLLNSFLPLLVRNHPDVQLEKRLRDEAEGSEGSVGGDEGYGSEAQSGEEERPLDESAPLLAGEGAGDSFHHHSKLPSPELRLSTKISSYGIGIGYLAAIVVQVLAVLVVRFTDTTTGSDTWPLRIVLFLVGAWWFTFTIPAAIWLRPRPGPPLVWDEPHTSNMRTCFNYFSYSWRSLGKTLKRARKLKDVLLFLSAWFMISDGIATVSGTAVLFAKTTLKMKTPELAFINVIVTITGVIGAFSWSKVSSLMGLKPSQTILACILLFEIIPIYGLLGYIPAIKRYGVFGLQQPWEMYPLGAVYGVVLGGLSSYCRSLFGELIPPGYEAAFYALYAITDKGSSIFGPAIVGAITDATGEIRPAFWFLAVLIGIPFPLMLLVDVNRGRRDATMLSTELDESRGKGVDNDSLGNSDARPVQMIDAEEGEGIEDTPEETR